MLGTNIDFGHPSDNGVINAISWINVGGVPLLIFLLLLLGAFSITGFLIQDIARMVAGPLPATLASVGAVAVSVPLVRAASRGIARVIPKDESYAVGLGDLVGRVGEVVDRPARSGAARPRQRRRHPRQPAFRLGGRRTDIIAPAAGNHGPAGRSRRHPLRGGEGRR